MQKGWTNHLLVSTINQENISQLYVGSLIKPDLRWNIHDTEHRVQSLLCPWDIYSDDGIRLQRTSYFRFFFHLCHFTWYISFSFITFLACLFNSNSDILFYLLPHSFPVNLSPFSQSACHFPLGARRCHKALQPDLPIIRCLKIVLLCAAAAMTLFCERFPPALYSRCSVLHGR